jgi:hypothetical protein
MASLAFVPIERAVSPPPVEAPAVTPKPAPPPPPPEPLVPSGWQATDYDGVFLRWCTEDPACQAAKGHTSSGGYVLAQVWCNLRRCGDIYARVNLIAENGTVVGWTNDTGYGDRGQVVQLTFSSYQENWDKVRLTQLRIRG